MKHRSIQHTFSSALGLLLFLFASSCISNKEIKNPELTTVQVSSFALASKANPNLEKVFFSIDHASGKIYNAHPLAFGTELDSVKISVGVQTTATLKLLFEGQELERSATDSISLRGRWKKGLAIEVSNQEKGVKKSYTVEIRSYPHDPDSYSWAPLSQQLPDLSGKETLFCPTEKDLYIFATKGTTSQLYHAPINTLMWEEVNMSGLSGQPIVGAVAAPDGCLYALVEAAPNQRSLAISENGGKQWATGNLTPGERQLLGAFIEPGQKQATLCMIEQDASGKKRFTRYSPNGGYKRGEEVPIDFPSTGYSTTLVEAAHHPLLILVGAKDSTGKPSRQTWSTTTGLDWLAPSIKEQYLLPPFEGADAPLLMAIPQENNKLCCIYPASFAPQRGASIYSSVDLGSTWEARKSAIMLPAAEQPFGAFGKIFGFSKDGVVFYLFGGHKADGSFDRAIWQGKSYLIN